ncbi:MAG TPA: ATP-binding protein [Vicinamibacterales bacterium]
MKAGGTRKKKSSRAPAPVSRRRGQDLLHELQVYTEEVEVQNEELRRARAEIEEARDRFADLYDFAPIGYLSLDHTGAITAINFAAAALLGRSRTVLLNLPFTALVAAADRERLRLYLFNVIGSDVDDPSPIEISLKTEAQYIVRLITRVRRDRGRTDVLVALVDITQERRLERERHGSLARESARAAELAREIVDRTTAEERVKALLERLVGIQEEERRRLSRNLHDHLGQQLTALRLAIGAVKERTRASGETNSRIGVIQSIVSDLDRDIDRLAWDLRPATLDDMGLSAALATLIRDWETMTGVIAEFHASAAPAPQPRLAKDIETHVYRIVQEALTNIAKHAAATRVSVIFKQEPHELSLIIEDDGRGFAPGTEPTADAGMGLVSMRERAALVGGELEIESMAGQGCTVFVKIPLRATTQA